MDSVIKVRDADGVIHYGARDSSRIQKGLADGSLTEVDQEVDDGPQDAAQGDDLNTGKSRRRSHDKERATGAGDVGDNPGVSGAEDTH